MSDWSGRRVGAYQIQRLLDSGMMVERYLGADEISGQQVMLLVLAQPTDEAGLFRFQRNLPITQGLTHAHIAPVLDAAVQDDTPFVVMDYLPTSRQTAPLPLPTVLRYASQLAGAFDAANRKHIVYPYATPDTILVGPGDKALLGGFPLRLLEISQISHDWQHPVSSAYLAPEQVSYSWPIDASVDQYAFALVVYEWLSGAPLFRGNSPVEIALQIVQFSPSSWQEQETRLPPALVPVLAQALAREPRERFANIGAFCAALWQVGQQSLQAEGADQKPQS